MSGKYITIPEGVKAPPIKHVQIATAEGREDAIFEEALGYMQQLKAKGLALNTDQIKAVQHVDGPFLTLAGAGSGKTSVLACRAGYLMSVKGIPSEQILLVTFTKKAAAEMKARMGKLPGISLQKAQRVQTSTFHSFFLSLLRAQGFKDKILSQESYKLIILKKMIREHKMSERLEPETLLALFSAHKLALKIPEELPGDTKSEREIRSLFLNYENWKRAHQQMDFDDILVKAYELLQASPVLLRKLQDRFQYIMVDEFQDTNTVQYALIQLMGARHRNIFVVGDDDQTIYSFNGAKHHFILDFDKSYPDAKSVTLGVNYRSTAAVVGLGHEIIRHNKKRKTKDLKAVINTEAAPLYARPQTTDEEADWIIQHIKERLNRGETTLRDTAILHRTANQARAMFEALTISGIPFVYEALGHQNFYEQGTVKPLLDHLRLTMNPKYEEAIAGILPSLFINREQGMRVILQGEDHQKKKYPLIHLTGINGLKPFQIKNIKERIKTIKEIAGLSPLAAVRHLRKSFYNKYMEADEARQLTLQKETLREAMDELEASAKRFDTISAFIAFIDDMLEKHHQMATLKQNPDADAVKLMTIHRSKGLEFPTVYLIGASEGMLPHISALEANEMEDVGVGATPEKASENAMEEERRLAYVAVTRAMKSLFISSPVFYRGKKAPVSRFIQEAFTGKKFEEQPGAPQKGVSVSEWVPAFVCTSNKCKGWQRITTQEERIEQEKQCPICRSVMKKDRKKISV